ncbi:type IX secretion system ring subunit PorN/GldN [Haloflavibacter putidus]|nr:gliding motility protein GldN [Haloflavibacter putidus]
MMNKQIYSLLVTGLLFVGAANAQADILNAKSVDSLNSEETETINEHDKPLDYGYVDDRDVLWAKTVWEFIDLNQRVNFPLYYPLDETPTRRSLFTVITDAIQKDSLNIYNDSYFMQKFSRDQLQDNLKARQITNVGIEAMNQGKPEDSLSVGLGEVVESELNPEDVVGYNVRGYWYFDKRQGELRYRLLGLAPMVTSAQGKAQISMAQINGDNLSDEQKKAMLAPVELFWVFYPELRPALHKAKVFNRNNTARPLSFDHLLNARRFDAVIYREDNVQGDRQIEDYVADNALMQLLESQRIKESIRNFESDMWNY